VIIYFSRILLLIHNLAGEINEETQYALKRFDIKIPDEIVPSIDLRRICLVDFNQRTQLTNSVKMEEIVCIFDHHSIQTEMLTPISPILLEIKPWGSCSTVVAWKYFERNHQISPQIAGILLSGILSDTLSLNSPTTTVADQEAVKRLLKIANGVNETDELTQELYAAKSNLDHLSIYEIINRDFKSYVFQDVFVGFGVIETIHPATHLNRTAEFIREMKEIKATLKLRLLFVAVVDIIKRETNLFIIGEEERELAAAAYPTLHSSQSSSEDVMHIGGRVSRKKEFIPPLQRLLMPYH